MKNYRVTRRFVLAVLIALLFLQLTPMASASEQTTTAHKHPIEITYPSAAQTTIAPGRDFYVIGTISNSLKLSDNTHTQAVRF